MPSTSEKQRRFMAAVAHDPVFAAKAGVSMNVGRKFNMADMKIADSSKAIATRLRMGKPRR